MYITIGIKVHYYRDQCTLLYVPSAPPDAAPPLSSEPENIAEHDMAIEGFEPVEVPKQWIVEDRVQAWDCPRVASETIEHPTEVNEFS